MLQIAVLIASYNRSDVTLRGLRLLFAALEACSDVCFRVFLVDDASPDGTGALVRTHFPQVQVIEGTGSLFWNRGMCLAYEHARSCRPADAYLLFNDDVVLLDNAFARMVQSFVVVNRDGPCALTAALVSQVAGEPTFGGARMRKNTRRLLNYEQLQANGSLQECDTFQGNCALLPAAEVDAVGGFDQYYHHSYGDIDLGHVLKRRGCRILLTPEVVGYCERDQPWRPKLAALTLCQRFQTLYAPPDPVSDFVRFAFKHRSTVLAAAISGYYVLRRLWRIVVPPPENANSTPPNMAKH